jgi:uncharacterized membrane protein YesL
MKTMSLIKSLMEHPTYVLIFGVLVVCAYLIAGLDAVLFFIGFVFGIVFISWIIELLREKID